MTFRLIRYSAILCLLIPLASAVTAEETRKPPNERLKLVTGPHYPPFAADYLPYKGLAPFIVTRILEDREQTVTVDMRPWKRAYRETLKGHYDAILPYVESPARRQDYLFSIPIFAVDSFAYVAADSKLDADSLEGLRGRTYCNPIGFTDEDALQAMRSNGELVRIKAATLKSCFRMLKAGRVDFVKINAYVADYVIAASDLKPDAIRPLPFVVETVSLHLMVPKTRPDAEALISTFNRRLKSMDHRGRIEVLKGDYLEAITPANATSDRAHRIGPEAAQGYSR